MFLFYLSFIIVFHSYFQIKKGFSLFDPTFQGVYDRVAESSLSSWTNNLLAKVVIERSNWFSGVKNSQEMEDSGRKSLGQKVLGKEWTKTAGSCERLRKKGTTQVGSR